MVLTEGSNVTGEILPLEKAADLCQRFSVPLLVDAAQTAGRFRKCLNHDGISFWCASAHKGLMGPAGLGILYVNCDLPLEPLVAGGTGSQSESLAMPQSFPDHLESGTMPAHLIATLATAIGWLEKTNLEKINSVQEHESTLMKRFLEWCSQQAQIKIYGFKQRGDRRGD